jgi:hypothetical protein
MSDPFSSDVYAVIDRLTRLRDLLCSGPQDVRSILAHLSGEYPRGESGKRAVRRDIRNLEVMGYQIEREGGHPWRWTLVAGPHMLSNADIDTLTYIRETFANKHPLAPAIQHLLTRLTRGLSDVQQPRWQRRPALRQAARRHALRPE